jgi:hypothetical protein
MKSEHDPMVAANRILREVERKIKAIGAIVDGACGSEKGAKRGELGRINIAFMDGYQAAITHLKGYRFSMAMSSESARSVLVKELENRLSERRADSDAIALNNELEVLLAVVPEIDRKSFYDSITQLKTWADGLHQTAEITRFLTRLNNAATVAVRAEEWPPCHFNGV